VALSAFATFELRNLGIYPGQEKESMSCACDEMNDEGRVAHLRECRAHFSLEQQNTYRRQKLLRHLYK